MSTPFQSCRFRSLLWSDEFLSYAWHLHSSGALPLWLDLLRVPSLDDEWGRIARKRSSSITFAIGLCAAVDESDTVLDELLGALDGGLCDFTVHCCG